MSFILNTLDLSDCVIHYQQIVKPSYVTTSIASKRMAKVHDYGYAYDTYFSDIELLLTDSQFASLKALVGSPLTLTSNLDLFFPLMTFPANTSVGLVEMQDYSWAIAYKKRKVHIKLKLLQAVTHTGTITEVQKLIDRGVVEKSGSVGLYSPNIVGSGYKYIQQTPYAQFTISHNLLSPYEASECLKYLLTTRAESSTVVLASRHCEEAGSKEVYLTDFRFTRSEENRYSLSIVVTVA